MSDKIFCTRNSSYCSPKREGQQYCLTDEEINKIYFALFDNVDAVKDLTIKQKIKEIENVLGKSRIDWFSKNKLLNSLGASECAMLKSAFKPKLTVKRGAMYNHDLNNSLVQYEEAYNDFVYIGSVFMDFIKFPFCLNHVFNLDTFVSKGKTKLAGIINFDKYTDGKKGSHWVALWVSLNKGDIYYYDSYGDIYSDEFKQLVIDHFIEFFKKKNIPHKIIYNKEKHQHGSKECGIFAMRFIINMLEKNENFKECTKYLNEKFISCCRKEFFYDVNKLN